MNYTYPAQQSLPVTALVTEQSRQRLIKAVISYKQGTAYTTEPAQQHLLNQFVQGRLTIDEVVYYLETTATSKS
ncbi:hypothetical protein [Hymenobacter sp. BT559]|jgi:hypothetical protein|uniref:hypothetical protein n=1 Tax=Hymenobacter sp. BT559 TaxID=2795729 RepID=UPI0018EC492D|nr:hypothetical protein [Hymenobacter sp. BT559]MBJ6145367.1 hypothetical protein [Hymenobacter sp. BT559]